MERPLLLGLPDLPDTDCETRSLTTTGVLSACAQGDGSLDCPVFHDDVDGGNQAEDFDDGEDAPDEAAKGEH